MATPSFTLGGVTFENPSPEQEAQYKKLMELKADVIAEPAVQEAMAGFRSIMPQQERYRAEHSNTGVTPESPEYLAAAAKLVHALGDSLNRHGIEGAPTNVAEFSSPTLKTLLPASFEGSVMDDIMRSAETPQTHSPLATPKIPENLLNPRSLGIGSIRSRS